MLNSPEEIVRFYQTMYAKHGATAEGMAWSDVETHWTRLSRLKRLLNSLDVPMNRILDVGCGIGMLYKVWDLKGTERTYHGIDVMPEYCQEARRVTANNPNAIVTCEDFLKWWSVDPFSVTVAVGTFAWQPVETVKAILSRMWELTAYEGAMAFTFLPGNPLDKAEVRIIGERLPEVVETLVYKGYSNRLDEHMVVFVKDSQPDWEAAYPYKHQEEIEQEVLMGEHRDG